MIIEKDFLNKLKDFGLNSYESKLWTALLSRGVSTAGELSDIANVPRSRTYDVLESLEKKGFAVMKIGKPIKYLAISPEEVVVRVKKNIQLDADAHTKILDELKSSEVLNELNTLFTQGIKLIDPSELAGNLKGRTNIYGYLENSFKKANKYILISTTETGLKRKAETLKPILEKASKRGVKVKIMAPLTKDTEPLFNQFSKFADMKRGNGSSRFFIIDGKKAVFALTDDKKINPGYDSAVWVESDFFAGSLQTMFDGVWKTLKSK